jgi:hypothetical protein
MKAIGTGRFMVAWICGCEHSCTHFCPRCSEPMTAVSSELGWVGLSQLDVNSESLEVLVSRF